MTNVAFVLSATRMVQFSLFVLLNLLQSCYNNSIAAYCPKYIIIINIINNIIIIIITRAKVF